MIPFMIIVGATVMFFVLERVLPGRELPEAPGWYIRAALLNLCQVGIILLAGVAWNRWLQSWSVFHISRSMPSFLQGLMGWFIGTFVFYWWHRARHDSKFFGESAIRFTTAHQELSSWPPFISPRSRSLLTQCLPVCLCTRSWEHL